MCTRSSTEVSYVTLFTLSPALHIPLSFSPLFFSLSKFDKLNALPIRYVRARVCVCVCLCVTVYVHACVWVYVCTCTHTHTHTHTYSESLTHTHACLDQMLPDAGLFDSIVSGLAASLGKPQRGAELANQSTDLTFCFPERFVRT
jgi:hypothetical protein